MRLEAIRLAHVGSFRQEVAWEGFVDGINVVAAKNESGKSTLLRAVSRCLFDRHTCKDQEIRGLQTIGTELSPRVEVEFETNEGSFRIAKSFLNHPESKLHYREDSQWKLISEGDLADARVRGLLQSTQPGRGATQTAHWGLMGYLWAQQGASLEWPTWQNEAGESIRSRLAGVSLDPVVDQIRSQLWDAFAENFTKTGQIRKGGELQMAEAERLACEVELGNVRSDIEEIEQQVGRFQELNQESGLLTQELLEARQHSQTLQKQARQIELVSVELDGLRTALQGAREALKEIREISTSMATTQEQLANVQQRLRSLGEDHIAAQKTLSHRSDLIHKAEEQISTLKADLKEVHRQSDRQSRLISWRQLCREEKQRKQKLEQVKARQAQVELCVARLAELPSVEAEDLVELEAVEQALRDNAIRIEALGLEVVLEPERKTSVGVAVGDELRSISMEAEQKERLTVPQLVKLHLEGWGTVIVRSGSVEVESLIQQQEELKSDLSRRLSQIGLNGIDEVRKALVDRRERQKELERVQAGLADSLEEGESFEQLASELSRVTRQRTAKENELQPDSDEAKITLVDLEARGGEIQIQREKLESLLEQNEATLNSERSTKQGAQEALQSIEKEQVELQARGKLFEERLAQSKSQYPEGLTAELERRQLRFVEAEARVKAREKELPVDPEKVSKENRRASERVVAIENRLIELKGSRDHLKGVLESKGEQGLYARETMALERMEAAKARIQHARDRAWAARLAHDLILRRKSEATREILKPLEDRLSATFAEISGDSTRRVFLDESLQLRGVGRQSDELVDFRLLSQGAKEQLLLCLRLAVAGELAEKGPQAVVLDDVLVNTDVQRQQRIIELLSAQSRNIQLIILTCHPEWYRGIGKLHRF